MNELFGAKYAHINLKNRFPSNLDVFGSIVKFFFKFIFMIDLSIRSLKGRLKVLFIFMGLS